MNHESEPPADTISARREKLVMVSQECHERPYLQLAIPPNSKKVLSIMVRIKSHDQGFADDPSQGSSSYFHVSVVNPSGHDRARWHGFDNRIANREAHTQTKTWPDSPHQAFRFRSFRANDLVVLTPIAHYIAWRNFVYSAEITIAFEPYEYPPLQPDLQTYAQSLDQNLYAPLESDRAQIRVLKLLPGHFDSTLVCHLELVELDNNDHQAFQAISYQWGDPTVVHQIQVADQTFPVTANLFKLLRQLRPSQGMPLTLWIDAICINQQDLDERAQQVQLMGRIYREAEEVKVWLGLQEELFRPEEIPRIREIFARDANLAAKRLVDMDEGAVLPYVCSNFTLADSQLDPMIAALGLDESIISLLEVEYFQRVWVMQEVHNACNVRVLCGDQDFSWFLVIVVQKYAEKMLRQQKTYRKQMPELFARLFFPVYVAASDEKPALYRYRRANAFPYTATPSMEIIYSVLCSFDMEATDPRDKIFALLGIEGFSNITDLPIDYKKDVVDVFCDFTRRHIIRFRSLDILSSIHCSVARSWTQMTAEVRDYDLDSQRASWSLWHDGKHAWGYTILANYQPRFTAAGDTTVDLDLLSTAYDSRSLLLKGRIVGVISGLKRFPYIVAAHRQNIVRDSEEYQMIVAYTYVTDTLNATLLHTAGSQSTVIFRDPAQRQNNQGRFRDHINAHGQQAMALGGAFPCQAEHWLRMEDGKEGIAPHTARSGDLIVIMNGAAVPYVFRECVGEMSSKNDVAHPELGPRRVVKLIGECYVSGVMCGEAMRDGFYLEELFEVF